MPRIRNWYIDTLFILLFFNMNTLKLTKEHFKKSTSYWSDYIWTEDVSNYQWHIEIDSNLWYVRFEKIKAYGKIVALAGTWIEAGTWIKAGWWIEAGTWIKAGWWIKAGLYIACKLTLSFSYAIFAWICTWRTIDESEKTITCGRKEGTGIVEHGILKEIGIPEETKITEEEKYVTDDNWNRYKLVPVDKIS